MWTTERLTDLEGGDVQVAIVGLDGGEPVSVQLVAREDWEPGDELDWPETHAIAAAIRETTGRAVELVGNGMGGAPDWADVEGYAHTWPLRAVRELDD